MNLEDYRLIPVWLLPIIVLILILTCGCRGGRSLSSGSAGTVIIPQTPQQINESNRPHFEPSPPVPSTPVRSAPVPQPTPPVKAAPVKIEPIVGEKMKPLSPTVKAPDNTLISPPQKSGEILESNNEQIIIPQEDMKVNWFDLFAFYTVCILALLTSWMLYDLAAKYFKNKKELDNQKKDVKVKKSAPKRKSKKRV